MQQFWARSELVKYPFVYSIRVAVLCIDGCHGQKVRRKLWHKEQQNWPAPSGPNTRWSLQKLQHETGTNNDSPWGVVPLLLICCSNLCDIDQPDSVFSTSLKTHFGRKNRRNQGLWCMGNRAAVLRLHLLGFPIQLSMHGNTQIIGSSNLAEKHHRLNDFSLYAFDMHLIGKSLAKPCFPFVCVDQA